MTLFKPRLEDANDQRYDLSADGQRFLLDRNLASDGVAIPLALDWAAPLERKSP